MQQILKQVLAEITPDNEKQLKKEADLFIKKINSSLKKLRITAKAVLGGSAAKGTWLKNDYDCDIFVQFAQKHKDENLSLALQEALEIFSAPIIVHGSRDYFNLDQNNIHYEIIPVFKINKKEEAMNVTDFSPMHVTWIKKQIKKNKKLKSEIMLLKRFCKANSLYGAESYINGFSGHVIDILTVKYKSFENVLKAAQKWEEKEVIDVENYYKKSALIELNKSKTSGPLIVIDPIDKTRNAAAALGYEVFNKFKAAARQFLKSPKKEFFEIKTIDLENLKKEAKNHALIILKIAPKEGKKDIVGCQIMKVFDHIKQQLENSEFIVEKSGWEWKAQAILYFITNSALAPEKICRGPMLNLKQHVAAFKKKHKNTFTKNGMVYAKEKRKYAAPEKLINELIHDKYIKERIKNIVMLK